MSIKYKTRKFRLSPPQVIALSFFSLIVVGGLLLSLPIATRDGHGLRLLDAMFTANSAVCVTGLVVVDTADTYSWFGRIVIMLLIQLGGLGLMTLSTIFVVLLGWKVGLRSRLLVQEALNINEPGGIVRLVKNVILYTLAVEGIGALILGIRFSFDFGIGKGMLYGLFHSVSAFNNAGIDLMGGFRSLTGYVGDLTVNLTIMGLIILGGIGFTVMNEIIGYREERRFSLHSRIVLKTTAILILGGALIIFLLEIFNPATFGQLTLKEKILAALFQSVTPRTAGFNTVDLTILFPATQIILVILMFIGASPNSTGGGIKTTTFATILMAVRANIRGNDNVEAGGRTIPSYIVQKAFTITFLALVWVMLVVMFLTLTEKADLLKILFETVSAFGTVGLSLGFTPHLSDPGRLAIMLTMFIGRVGPLTLALALAEKRSEKAIYKYAEEKILVG